MTKGNIYRVIDLARMFAVHPNTIRLYEKLSYISKAQRSKNGYREFTELHVLQLQICRKIFGYPFTKRAIRKTGDALLHAIAKQDWQISQRRYEDYIAAIRNEIQLAEQAGIILLDWSSMQNNLENENKEKRYNRKEVAEIFGVTVEAVRNWERNGLVHANHCESTKTTYYSEKMLVRFHVIYMLRQAGYSISAIHRSMSDFDHRKETNIVVSLHQPEQDELFSVGDRWLYELRKLENEGIQIPNIINQLITWSKENSQTSTKK